MTTKYTISVQHGPRVSRGHNLRDTNAIKNQVHILRGGLFEVWVDEEPHAAYSRLFDQALGEYNALRKERRKGPITSYYRKVCSDGRLKPVYEAIVTIGNCKHRVDDETGKKVFKQYVDEWQKRNPNFEIIGVYYHADERDPETGLFGAPHLHLDYVPVAYNCQRGLSTQTSQSKAFEQMGIKSFGRKRTAQMVWQEREREALKEICRAYGLEIASPKKEKRQHLETELYKMKQKAEEKVEALNAQANRILTKMSAMLQESENLEDEIEDVHTTLERFEAVGLSKKNLNEIQEISKGSKIEVDASSYLSLKLTAADACEVKEKQREAEAKQVEAELKRQEAEKKQQEAEANQRESAKNFDIMLTELHRKLKESEAYYDTLNSCFEAAVEAVREVDPDLAEKAIAAAREVAVRPRDNDIVR